MDGVKGAPMTPIDLKELRRLCNAAMGGPWLYKWRHGHRVVTEQLDGDDESTIEIIARVSGVMESAEFIAMANPDTVRRMIDVIEKYEEALKLLYLGDWSAISGKEHYDQYAEEALDQGRRILGGGG